MKIIKIAEEITTNMVQNPNCPPEILAKAVRSGKDDVTSCTAAQNPNCPPEVLIEVLRREKDDMISQNAAYNVNCPPKMLVEVVLRGNDNMVSRYAANNPNCPKEYKWLWEKAKNNHHHLGFLGYPESIPEIKQDPKIKQVVIKSLFEFLKNNFDLVFPVPKKPFNEYVQAKIWILIDELSDEDFIISLYSEKVDEVMGEEKSKRKINVGDKVRVVGGGVYSNQSGTVVNSWAVKTDGKGVPINVDSGDYKPVDWKKEVAIRLDNGKLITMFKNYITKI